MFLKNFIYLHFHITIIINHVNNISFPYFFNYYFLQQETIIFDQRGW